MPIYEFDCRHCDTSFESLSKPFERVQCPGCGTFEITNKITAPACYIRGAGDWGASEKPNKDRATEK